MKRCIWALLLCAACAASPDRDGPGAARAELGVATVAPSAAVAEALELPFRVRLQGRAVERVAPRSAAERLGLKPGDVLLALDGVDLYSGDDLADVLRVHRPGDEVEISFHPAGDPDVVETTVALGTGQPAAPGIDWQFASLAMLGRAEERARAENKGILVGLSGAET